jgi:hypothetical protein
MPSMSVLSRAGIDVTDPFGWTAAFYKPEQTREGSGALMMGSLLSSYLDSKEARTEKLLAALVDLLNDYQQRVRTVEGYLYMEYVGIKLEKHFNEKRIIHCSLSTYDLHLLICGFLKCIR